MSLQLRDIAFNGGMLRGKSVSNRYEIWRENRGEEFTLSWKKCDVWSIKNWSIVYLNTRRASIIKKFLYV